MKFIKLFTATFIAIFSLSNITLADSVLNEILRVDLGEGTGFV